MKKNGICILFWMILVVGVIGMSEYTQDINGISSESE